MTIWKPAALAVALLAAPAGAEDHSGRYRLDAEQGPVILELKQAPDGSLAGSVSGFGVPIQLVGRVVSGAIQGQYAVALLSPYGGGAAVAAIVEAASFGAGHRSAVDSLARSFRFTRPQAPPQAQGWQQKLAGYCLAYRSSSYSAGASYGGYGTYSGFSDRSNYFLGADGSFGSDASSSSSFDGGGGFGGVHSGSGPRGGRWRIGGQAGAPTLEIQYGDGRSVVHRLSSDERGRTYLDGDRWLRVTFQECREN